MYIIYIYIQKKILFHVEHDDAINDRSSIPVDTWARRVI